MMNKASNRTKNNLKGVHPDLIMVITYALAISEIDFFVNEGVRTLQRQQELYAQGRTKKSEIINGKEVKLPIVTNVDGVNKKSNHQVKSDGYGHAIDVYYVGFKNTDSYNDDRWEKIYSAIKTASMNLGIPITLGSYWKNFVDKPHFEIGDRNW